jgi:hypothetical protein
MTQETLTFADLPRLAAQRKRVFDLMQDARWRTGDPEASVSARLRDFRKTKYGGYDVERTRVYEPDGGLWTYRLLVTHGGPAAPAPALARQ